MHEYNETSKFVTTVLGFVVTKFFATVNVYEKFFIETLKSKIKRPQKLGLYIMYITLQANIKKIKTVQLFLN